MSLISLKNWTTPFSSFVNLVTILVIAVLFGIWRLMGGGIDISDSERRAPAKQEVSVPKANEQREFRRSELEAELNRQESELLDNFLLKEDTTSEKRQRDAKKEKEKSSLDEIERSLGLR